ncbi:diguanylate cyclase domain-containing protein [Jeotgalibaca caeni]|uniref:diguanylate cyclase domain-containing protein n=1 Tax=Jeotgalibaca caeni TaxID=3028623 RepID=UPI00237DE36C|nr:diguanylate cyclase [Jeotgalibaca caeni]MDE1547817.1 diguanylate cyclase [Jeotgalibaca caeni]
MRKKLVSLLIAFVGVALLAIPIYSLQLEYESQYRENAKTAAAQELRRIKEVIQADLKFSLNYAHFLELVIKQNPDFADEELGIYAEMITSENPLVDTVFFTRKGIVDFIYPLPEGGQELLGGDIFKDPTRIASLQYAIENRTAVTQGPLIEENMRVYNRQPIFIEDEFYGFVSISVDFYTLLKENDVTEEKGELSLALQVDSPYSEVPPEVVWGDPSVLEIEPVTEVIEFPGEEWILAAYPKTGWDVLPRQFFFQLLPYYISLIVFFLTVFTFVFLYWDRREKAYFDGLTQTLNKVHFERYVDIQLKLNRGNDAMLLVDLNEFKNINDTYGHSVGDKVLTDVSERIRKTLRTTDKLGRIGGDEFMVYLKDVDSEKNLALIQQKIYEAMKEPFIYRYTYLHATLAIGAVMIPPNATFQQVYEKVDRNMYIQKTAIKEAHKKT